MKGVQFIVPFVIVLLLAAGSQVSATPTRCNPDLDTAGHQTGTANHLNIGGHIFAGEYPINNPEPTGDTGYVYLYRVQNNSVLAVDSTWVTTFGYYTFSNIIQGEYLLKAGLTAHSTHYHSFFPTYFVESIRWNHSDHLTLLDSNRFEVNVHLQSTITDLTGPASMSGIVMQTLKDQGFTKLGNTEIVLLNSLQNPIAFTYSDQAGIFSFSNLPFDTYYLMVEATGKYPTILRVILDENNPTINNLQLEVLSHAPMMIDDVNLTPRFEVGPIYPNPTAGELHCTIEASEPQLVTIEVWTWDGQQINSWKEEVRYIKTVAIPTQHLSSGTYYVSVHSQYGSFIRSQKMIKR